MVIRPATRDDLPGILAIYNDAVLNTTATADYEPHTLEKRARWFDDHARTNLPIFVAGDTAGRVVGWSSLSAYHGRVGYRFSVENSVYVAADLRGRGIGKLLLPPLIEAGQQLGLHVIIASIDSSNEASLRLHASCGFEYAGRLREVFCKFGRWLDVITMQRLLNDLPPLQVETSITPCSAARKQEETGRQGA
ncbi:MAG TPA: GNAT family N-acetyltransferase [Chthonomonadaceae bacterium]|nr:GNAT family N-acetyltransferase [Chthonomonadaceae bacterium]